MLYAQQHAWLSAYVDDAGPRWKKDGEDRLPEEPSTMYLITWLLEIGPTVSNGFGQSGLSWTDILSWQTLSGRQLEYYEALAIQRLSDAYAAMLTKASDKDCQAPFDYDLEFERKTASSALEALLDKMIAERATK